MKQMQGRKTAPKPPVDMKEIPRKTYKGGGGLVKESEQHKWLEFPMKTQNMNEIVQLRKKRPKMTFVDKQQFDCEQEQQAYLQHLEQRTRSY